MNNVAGNSRNRRHSLSDWLTLHELDAATCHRVLNATGPDVAGDFAVGEGPEAEYHALDLELASLRAVEAMRAFLPQQHGIIGDTFENTARIVVDRPDKSRKALTLDNGPAAYPTILLSYRGEPADFLVVAHEFGHAVQIRASRGLFVPPIIREVCAFLGESALLSHTRQRDLQRYPHLVRAWRNGNARYFGAQRERLRSALSQPDAAYSYSWNYPIARHIALQISRRWSEDRIWSVFEGKRSVRGVLRELSFTAD